MDERPPQRTRQAGRLPEGRRLALLFALLALGLAPTGVSAQPSPSSSASPAVEPGTGSPPASGPPVVPSPSGVPRLAGSRPNIVVVYLDDVSPHDGRLWSDLGRTRALAGRYVLGGVTFSRAVGETPLCCPGRAGTLTGLHTHHHGVTTNDVRLFDPRVTLATEMHAAGYHTMLIGKYLNDLRRAVPPGQVRRYARGWDDFDVIYENNGKYFDYDLWTREGMIYHGTRPRDHSTGVITRRAVDRIAAAPADKPIFALLTVVDLHARNQAMQRDEGSWRCRSIEDWAPPSYNEKDVSDKPRWVRTKPPLRSEAHSLRRYCEQMLGIDRLQRRLEAALAEAGRLEDTLFIFTADNGMAWGEHRFGHSKAMPYATPVPLYVSWPRVLGGAPRTIDEPVSNIDLAPTICELAGCQMGPYRGGRPNADGISLLPLLSGEATSLGREGVIEQGVRSHRVPGWRAMRTTPASGLGAWRYIEYTTGERELYDLAADPWELENVAGDPSRADLVADLAARLRRAFRDRAGSG